MTLEVSSSFIAMQEYHVSHNASSGRIWHAEGGTNPTPLGNRHQPAMLTLYVLTWALTCEKRRILT